MEGYRAPRRAGSQKSIAHPLCAGDYLTAVLQHGPLTNQAYTALPTSKRWEAFKLIMIRRELGADPSQAICNLDSFLATVERRHADSMQMRELAQALLDEARAQESDIE